MKSNNAIKLRVKRISSSPYFKADFFNLEKAAIESKSQSLVLPYNSLEAADVLITNTHTLPDKINEADLEHCQLMIHPNSGHDNFSPAFVKKAQFPIVLGNPIRAHAVTNYILSALFNHYGAIPAQSSWDPKRNWPRKLLSELTILILGAGHIGSLLKQSLTPLVDKLIVVDPYQNLTTENSDSVDVVILACSLNSKNHGMINRTFLEQMPSDFLLINAARGALVNEEDLIHILKTRPKAFAVLDVFEEEPKDFSVFNELNNLILSSHVAGVFSKIDLVTAEYSADVIHQFQILNRNEFEEKFKNILLKNRLIENDFLI